MWFAEDRSSKRGGHPCPLASSPSPSWRRKEQPGDSLHEVVGEVQPAIVTTGAEKRRIPCLVPDDIRGIQPSHSGVGQPGARLPQEV